eukprot:sb/3463639/
MRPIASKNRYTLSTRGRNNMPQIYIRTSSGTTKQYAVSNCDIFLKPHFITAPTTSRYQSCIKSCKFICPYCLFIHIVYSLLYLSTVYRVFIGIPDPNSRHSQRQKGTLFQTKLTSRNSQRQNVAYFQTIPNSRHPQRQNVTLFQTQKLTEQDKKLALYDRLQHRSVVRQSLVRYNLEPHTHTHILASPVTTIGKEEPDCPPCGERCSSSVRMNGYCYHIISDQYTDYDEAKMNCLDLGGDLLSTREINEAETQLALREVDRAIWLQRETDRCYGLYPVRSGRVWEAPCSTLMAVICKSNSGLPTAQPPPTPPHSPLGCQLSTGPLASSILLAHNALRMKHQNTGRLCWSSGLARDAWNYARYLGNQGGVEHSYQRGGQGENIFSTLFKKGHDTAWYYNHAVHRWYEEVRYYRWDEPGLYPHYYGHFAQVAWRATMQVGCAHAFGLNKDGKKRIVIICRGGLSLFKRNIVTVRIKKDIEEREREGERREERKRERKREIEKERERETKREREREIEKERERERKRERDRETERFVICEVYIAPARI